MKQITEKIHIEDQLPGVTVGAICLPHGLILVDAPPSIEDGRSWRASMMNLSSGIERVLINLDSHYDRTLGARAMDCPIIAHEKITEAFRSRPSSVKTQGEDTGADWESLPGIGTVRWSPPEISFTGKMAIQWNDTPVFIESHDGPCNGACWAIIPSEQVVFVGDLITKNQPLFFSGANLADWLTSIQILQERYPKFKVIAGRGGVASANDIAHTAEVITFVQTEIAKSGPKQNTNDLADKLTQSVLSMYTVSNKNKKQYELRLQYGLKQYILKHTRSAAAHS